MKKLSITKMTDTIIAKRKEQKLTQAQLAEMTGINRGMISRLESSDYTPSIDQLQSIAEVLNFEVVDLFEDDKVVSDKPILDKKYNIAVLPLIFLQRVFLPAAVLSMSSKEQLFFKITH